MNTKKNRNVRYGTLLRAISYVTHHVRKYFSILASAPLRLCAKIILIPFITFIYLYLTCLPSALFNDPNSTVLLDNKGELLAARIAGDGQWRFEAGEKIPVKFAICLLQFEDRDFFLHRGVSLRGIGRALKQNISSGKIVSGGSTITMQLVRLYRKNPPRTILEKISEMIVATRLEFSYSKAQLLNMYSAHAPFGSNVVGLEAAAWRYFGRSPDKLSWSECATLAVLPNAPGLIYPGKNHRRLQEKRNRLLTRLKETGIIDATTYSLALTEPLPEKPLALPQGSVHLLDKALADGKRGKVVKTTVDKNLQEKVMQILAMHHEVLKENNVHNGAVLIASAKTGKVLAYIGNTKEENDENGNDVDIIQAARSTGSTLKPLLYARMLDEGEITPRMLVPDVPTQIGGYSPKNFNFSYDGAVPANRALARSLNIPAVRMLNQYGVEKFHHDLKAMGYTTINRPANTYGLSLILGGAEAKLWDMVSVYCRMSKTLQQYPNYKQSLNEDIFYTQKSDFKKKKRKAGHDTVVPYISAASVWSTFEAMVEVNRPDEEGSWRSFSSAQKIAWKTGTSFGNRDAWAIGITQDYVVGVWIGNADGEGRPGLTGVKAAAPVLFDVFSLLPKSAWFRMPEKEMVRVSICSLSGHRSTELCEKTDSTLIPKTALSTLACPYHQSIHLDRKGKYRVEGDCEDVNKMKHLSWFVLPPLMEKYYKFNNPSYKTLPEYLPGCGNKTSDKAMTLVYPKRQSKIYVPVLLDGKTGKTVFEAAHRNRFTKIYWHLDDIFIGETQDIHQLEINPSLGKHRLMIIDEQGVSATTSFEVLGKESGEMSSL
ncbi:MAG: penicillin-binding protein 1C [Bacteroidia bacterium]